MQIARRPRAKGRSPKAIYSAVAIYSPALFERTRVLAFARLERDNGYIQGARESMRKGAPRLENNMKTGKRKGPAGISGTRWELPHEVYRVGDIFNKFYKVICASGNILASFDWVPHVETLARNDPMRCFCVNKEKLLLITCDI